MDSNALVLRLGLIHAEGCRIPVPTHWNVELFKELLIGYHDQDLLKFIEFGWPLKPEFESEVMQSHTLPVNQAGARANPAKLDKYLSEEIGRGSVIGPFKENPLGKHARFSPLDAIPKKESQDLRIIMNLSFPHDGSSINVAISKDSYLEETVDLSYPNLDDLVKIIKTKEGEVCCSNVTCPNVTDRCTWIWVLFNFWVSWCRDFCTSMLF